MDFDFDLFVIGGGSGGVRAARVAAGEAGARVGLAEESRMGGTCVIRGCVPKKLMVFASEYAEGMHEAADYGWDVRIGGFDWPKFRTRLETELDRLEGVYNSLLEGSGVTIFAQRATVADAHTVRLADGSTKTAKHILIAAGGRPSMPEFENIELAISSNDVFHLDELPRRLLVVGGGYIACEMACIFNGLGTDVTQFYRGAQILRGFDGEARGHIAEHMQRHGIGIHCGTNILSLEKTDDGIEVRSTTGDTFTFDQVLFATGRTPNTAGLGLEDVGVELGRRGEVVVDDYSQTAVPSIYAIGDVTNRVQLTPVAIREGMAFVETVFKGNPTPVDHALIPSAVFTQPEYGSVGLSEEDAREQEPIDVYATSFRPMHKAFIGRDDRVLMKLIVSQETRKVLGVHIVSDKAGEMIQLAGVAVKMGATKEDFDRTVAVHPTMSEELVTLKTPVRTA
ncbi:glutathione-disulfide reductase [Tropicimonas isoalkanivorans]|uniref:Glutathione reductase n=1 Tax=Tropicimonas isoalkanivorans TaxID=441112 RepID=A0A1I1JT62_9RHOB|nr:glutathione-disulfide reductase [Tropicimonas isoalkanivorans]SFC48550.1 NADPH-glutathione reductase [Tropicimonas isoalkanivorans]